MQELICVYIYIIYISSYSHICMYSIIYSQSINPDYCDIFATKLWISILYSNKHYNFNLYNCRNMSSSIYSNSPHLIFFDWSTADRVLLPLQPHFAFKFLLYFQNMNNVYNTFKDNYEYTECLGMPKYSCYPITFVYDSQRANDIIT